MTEYKVGCATVRIHGQVDQAAIKAATERYIKRCDEQRKRKAREAKRNANNG